MEQGLSVWLLCVLVGSMASPSLSFLEVSWTERKRDEMRVELMPVTVKTLFLETVERV